MSVADVALSPIRKESIHSAGHCGNQLGRSASDSILIYLNLGSSVMPMCVSESDSIASVKLRIQTSKGFVAKKQKLVFEGRELARGDTPIKDYGVTGGNFLHLVRRLSDLLHITVRTICGKEFDFHVDRYKNVGYLKQRILRKGEVVVDPKGQELFCNGEKLDDQRVINDICNKDDAKILWVAQKSAEFSAEHIEDGVDITVVAEVSKEGKDENVDEGENQPVEHVVENGRESPIRVQDIWLDPIIVNPKAELPHFIWDMVNSTFEGLEKGCEPIRSSEGTGGTYLLRDCLGEKFVSVFKPMDEEPSAVNNPCGLPVSSDGEGLKKGTRVGEGAVKEVATYILDHPRSGPRMLTGEAMGFAGVPPTLMVKCLHKGFNHPKGYQGEPRNVKIGSLQMFMKNDGSCEDMGPRSFPIDEVHKISVFDIRMANADRHSGNILIGKGKEGQTVLIPIDHGYCLPESFEDCTFDWLHWPQARQPYSPETIEYINSLNAEQDIALLKFYGCDIPLECVRTLQISTMLLKKGVQRGLTPFAIGSIMCRETVKKESVIEEIICKAQDYILPEMSDVTFLEIVSQIMDSRLDMLSK